MTVCADQETVERYARASSRAKSNTVTGLTKHFGGDADRARRVVERIIDIKTSRMDSEGDIYVTGNARR